MRQLFDVVRLRARSLFRRSRADEELDRELRAHLEYQVEENIARGMSAADARRAAVRTLVAWSACERRRGTPAASR